MRVGFIAMDTPQGAATAQPIAAAFASVVAAEDPRTVAAMAGSGCTVVDSFVELASSCEVVIFRELDDAAIERLIAVIGPAMAPNGILVNARPWGVPSTLKHWAQLGADVGIIVLDAMTSGPVEHRTPAEPSWASLMVGGDRDGFDRCLPVLSKISTTVAHVGGPGAGELAKLVNTLVFTANIMVIAELIKLGEELGFELGALLDLIRASSGASSALDSVATSALDRVGGRQRNIDMFLTRLDAVRAELRARGIESPLATWARRGVDALPAALDRVGGLVRPAES